MTLTGEASNRSSADKSELYAAYYCVYGWMAHVCTSWMCHCHDVLLSMSLGYITRCAGNSVSHSQTSTPQLPKLYPHSYLHQSPVDDSGIDRDMSDGMRPEARTCFDIVDIVELPKKQARPFGRSREISASLLGGATSTTGAQGEGKESFRWLNEAVC
jgi:hypothetical protein